MHCDARVFIMIGYIPTRPEHCQLTKEPLPEVITTLQTYSLYKQIATIQYTIFIFNKEVHS